MHYLHYNSKITNPDLAYQSQWFLTLWNQFAFNEGAEFEARIGSFPIIIGVRLRVTSYNGNKYTHIHRSIYTYVLHNKEFNLPDKLMPSKLQVCH